MKKIRVKLITISSLILIVSLFLISLFSKYKNGNDMAFVVENNNLIKMDDSTSLRFNEALKRKKIDFTDDNIVEVLVDNVEINEEENIIVDETNNDVSEIVVETPKEEEVSNVTSLSEEREVLQTVVGNLTGYGPDCAGCGGHTSTGFDLNQSIYYEDSEYGTVRILAADPSFPFYSIFRVSNVPTMDDFIGIVLDRGGNVGFGRGTLFDLAFESEYSPNLVPLTHNVTFELLRSGR